MQVLRDSKAKSDDINAQQAVARRTEADIHEARLAYAPVARQGATAFFVVLSLHHLQPMYAFSVQWFHRLFVRAVETSPPAEELPERLRHLRTFLMELLFRQV